MKRRDETRPRHPDAPYAEIELPGGHNGRHLFRIPSPLAARHLIEVMREGDEITGNDMIRIHGALVGMAWWNDSHDLESVKVDDVLAYGEAVFEELYAVGYRVEHLSLFATIILNEINKQLSISAEVTERLGFLRPKPEPSDSITSGSDSSTSATHSHTTA
tara:strand:+ start:212 stop:694 length:483 start_codon:yes stop_codon:yes gene_type:complete